MLNFLYIAISWVLLRWHDLFSTILDADSGITWALSIVMLVVTIRILLFRFFIKQVHSQRKMQEVQPKIAALREKYKNDRQTLSQEMMKLQKEEGFNPISGCLPILMQAPVFLALFHVLRLIGTEKAVALSDEYTWTVEQARSAGAAKLFGGAPIAASFRTEPERLVKLAGDLSDTRIVAGVLIVLMVAATYITQRQIIARSSATQVMDGQQAMIQKLLLYGMPASLFVSGFLFPIGVLLYWFTNNLWTMGQQFYILKRMPHPAAKDTRPSVDVKALAPKPGQKPVRPERRPAAIAGATEDAEQTELSTDGTAPAAGNDSPPAGRTGKAPGRAGRTPRTGAASATPPAKANGRADGAAATPPAKTDGKTAAAPPPAKASGKADGKADGAAAVTPPAADPDAPDTPVDGEKPAPSGSSPAPRGTGSGAKPGGGRPGGGGRRPQGQRSPTQTRQKKKRR